MLKLVACNHLPCIQILANIISAAEIVALSVGTTDLSFIHSHQCTHP